MNYDVIVIGGGPAGMIAAGRAGELGAKVVLLEKNERLGVKLLITGGGRCNFTNNIPDIRELVLRYGKKGKFLYPSFNDFRPSDVIDFFNNQGVKTKVEKEGRAYPLSDRASDILGALKKYLSSGGVEVRTGVKVKDIIYKNNQIVSLDLGNGKTIQAKKYIVCAGGKAYPATGSDGAAYKWIKRAGHNIIMPAPGLTSIIVKEKNITELEGLSLSNVKATVRLREKNIATKIGDAIFTSSGLSGPLIHDLSREICYQEMGDGVIELDVWPKVDQASADRRLIQEFTVDNNKKLKNCLNRILPNKLSQYILKAINIFPEKEINAVTRAERQAILRNIKNLKLQIKELTGFEKAMITVGGVDLKEINPRTMGSKIIKNLFLAGEIIDIDGPTGGFNLQIAWSTGHLAGGSVID